MNHERPRVTKLDARRQAIARSVKATSPHPDDLKRIMAVLERNQKRENAEKRRPRE